jgi:hypothetical protein
MPTPEVDWSRYARCPRCCVTWQCVSLRWWPRRREPISKPHPGRPLKPEVSTVDPLERSIGLALCADGIHEAEGGCCAERDAELKSEVSA